MVSPFPSYQMKFGTKSLPAGAKTQASFCAAQMPVFLPGADIPKFHVASFIPIKEFLNFAKSHGISLFLTKISMVLLPSERTICEVEA